MPGSALAATGFNSQPREGGWLPRHLALLHVAVSTRSRAKAAGENNPLDLLASVVSTRSRAKAAGPL